MSMRPLFLVGADTRSLEWLAHNRERLVALGAVGMIVRAHDAGDLQRIQSAAKHLPLFAASGEAIARELGLVHYPVLITAQGVEQ